MQWRNAARVKKIFYQNRKKYIESRMFSMLWENTRHPYIYIYQTTDTKVYRKNMLVFFFCGVGGIPSKISYWKIAFLMAIRLTDSTNQISYQTNSKKCCTQKTGDSMRSFVSRLVFSWSTACTAIGQRFTILDASTLTLFYELWILQFFSFPDS